MKLSLLEMDFDARRKKRRPDAQHNPAQHYIDLVRNGTVTILDLTTAAVFGDEAAREAVKTFGETAPTIESPADIIHMFGLDQQDLRIIFKTLYDHFRKHGEQGRIRAGVGTVTETAAWAMGQSRNPNEQEAESAAQHAIGEIARAVGLKTVIDILKRKFVVSALGGESLLR